MNRTVKIFCRGEEQKEVSEKYTVIEKYDGFLLAEVSESEQKGIAGMYPTEDITDQYTLRVGERTIDTSVPRFGAKGKLHAHPAYKGVKTPSPGRHHHIVQFIGPIKDTWLKQVDDLGGQPREPLGDFAYIVRADERTLEKIISLPFVRWAGHLPHGTRIAKSALDNTGRKAGDIYAELPRTRVMPGIYVIEFFGADDVQKASSQVKKAGTRILETNPDGKVMTVEVGGNASKAKKTIEMLSAVHGVRLIRERSLKRTSNDVAAQIMGTAQAIGNSGLGLSGKGEYIAVCDTGLDTGDRLNIHKDFSRRVYSIQSYPMTPDLNRYVNNPGGDDGPSDIDSGHGTHVAGSVLGNGAASQEISSVPVPIRGLAYRARLVFQAVEQEMKWKSPADVQRYGRYLLAGIPNDLTQLFNDAYNKRARIHSNSWGGGDPGRYDVQCEQLDRFVWEHKDFCILVAAGNDGTDNDGDGKINLMSVTSPGTAKNCITVGACESKRDDFASKTYGSWWPKDYPVPPFKNGPMADSPDQVVAFSSRGPSRDNRFKPDIIAPGTFVLSTRSTMLAPNNTAWAAFPLSKHYFFMGGTSMATPLTSGAAALIREYLRKKKKIRKPTAALLKAALIAGATRLTGYAPAGAVVDNHQGYGRVNIDAVLSPPSPVKTSFMEVKPGLRTGAVWTHEIDVRSDAAPFRIVLAYSDYPGPALVNNLNLILYSPNGSRFVGNQSEGHNNMSLDSKNNVEVVHIQKPATGKWRIEVIGSNVPQSPQDFSLVYLGHIPG